MAYTDIDKSSDYFETKLYAGNDTGQSITMDFAPDWVWIKDRGGADPHGAYDSVRGALKQLRVNLTNEERTLAGSLTSFNSDGFTVGNDDGTNDIGHNFVSWNWKANGAGSSNTDGSITSTVSANTTSGFSIVSYTGTGSNATVGHGLGSVPKIVLTKNRTTADNWLMYHASTGNTKALYLNGSFAPGTSSAYWNNTSPTSSVFSVGTEVPMNKSGDSIIAYCFSEVKGFSKFGSYTGNGSSDGTFVYTGFKPAWIMIKRTNDTRNWLILDNKRNTYNPYNTELMANLSNAEETNIRFDSLSNGFKFRLSSSASNASSAPYIYMAFAENPFVTSTGIPTTAR